MTIIQQSALLPYSDRAMFELVNDIESYPSYMEGCLSARVLRSTDSELEGRLELGKGRISYSFTTVNILKPPSEMLMELVEGPFKKFQARWTFEALGEDACKVSLFMDFEFASGLIDFAMRQVFDSISKNQVDAVCRRAEQLYGQ